MYPVFALPAFVVTRSRVAARAALLCVAAFGVYCIYSLRDIAHVAEIATQGEHFSYGARILPAHLYHQVGADRWAGPAALKQLIAAVPLGDPRGGDRRSDPPSPRPPRTMRRRSPRPRSLALHVGALIYLGTFATANNFDYRLVFLLLTLPQLVEWASMPAHRLSSLASATLVGDSRAALGRQPVAVVESLGRARELGGRRPAGGRRRRHGAQPGLCSQVGARRRRLSTAPTT